MSMNGTKNESGETSLYSDHDSNSESGVDARQNVKDIHHMEVERMDDESNNWSRQSNAGSSDESDAEGHRDAMNITLESDVSGAGGDPLDSLRSSSPVSDARNDDESPDKNHSIRIVNIGGKRGSSRSGSTSPIDSKLVSGSGYSSSADVKSPLDVRSNSGSPVEVKSGSSSPVDINSESDVESTNDEKEINTIDSDTDDEDCMIVDDATKAKARQAEILKRKRESQPEVEDDNGEMEEVGEPDLAKKVKTEEGESNIEVKKENIKPTEEDGDEEKIKEEKKDDGDEEKDTPTVRRSLRNTQRKKYQDPDEDDIGSDDSSMKKNIIKTKTPIKVQQFNNRMPMISNIRSINSMNPPQLIRFPNLGPRPDISKALHNGVVSSNVINNMAQRGVSITPASRGTAIVYPKKPPVKPKRQPPFPPESMFANMVTETNIIEAPSFLSPFIFVKKPNESLKKFVEDMGKEIEEEKRKEEEQKKEEERKVREEQELKDKIEKEKMEKEMLELAEKAKSGVKMEVDEEAKEPVLETKEAEQNGEVKVEEQPKKKTSRRRRRDEDNDESWSEGDVSDSSEEEEEDTVILKQKTDDDLSILKVPSTVSKGEIKSDLDPKVQAYFATPLGNFFIDIGFNLVQERVQTDLLKLQTRKMKNSAKTMDVQSMEAAMNLLTSNIQRLKRDNFPFNFSRVRCQFCSFKTESALVMANHMEVPHTAKNGLFRCNFCPIEFQSPQLILSHVSSEHGVTARLLKPQSLYECPECPFESQTKGRYLKHIEKCSKLQSEVNILKPQEWQPPAKLIKASARPSYNFNYRPRPPVPPPRPGVFRPVQPTPVSAGSRIIRPAEGFNPSVIGMRPRPIMPPRPVILPPRPGISSSNLKCGMCGSYYPDAIRLREHVMKDHARAVSALVT